jgi:hypothetical protein
MKRQEITVTIGQDGQATVAVSGPRRTGLPGGHRSARAGTRGSPLAGAHPGILSGMSAADLHRPQGEVARMDLTMTLRMCRFMVSRMHLTETDGAVWLFPASSGAATLVGVIHLTKPSRSCASGGHALAAVFARVIWSLASELTGLPTAVAVLFPCGTGRVLEIAGAAGRFLDVGPDPAPEGGPMYLARDESVAAALLAHAQRIASTPLN